MKAGLGCQGEEQIRNQRASLHMDHFLGSGQERPQTSQTSGELRAVMPTTHLFSGQCSLTILCRVSKESPSLSISAAWVSCPALTVPITL